MKETLWTIQDAAAFEVFQRTGVLRADPKHLNFGGEYRHAYDWMSDQMCQRIGAAPDGVQYPVWAWYQWEGKRKCRDLRQAGYAKIGTPMVQITFEADTNDFLLSDFDDWHIILANHYIADSEQDWDDFYANGGESKTDDVIAYSKMTGRLYHAATAFVNSVYSRTLSRNRLYRRCRGWHPSGAEAIYATPALHVPVKMHAALSGHSLSAMV